MKILDRYILNEFIRAFLGILGILTLLLSLKQLLRELSDILLKEPAFSQVVLYFIYALPGEILFNIPITVILAIMFSLGSLAKHKELLAIHASGMSYLRMALPLGALLILVTFATYLCNETLIPGCRERAYYIKEIVFKGKDKLTLTRNKKVTTKGAKNRFYTMKNFYSGLNIMEQPIITEHTEDGRSMTWRLDAKSGQLVEKNEEGSWQSVNKALKGKNYSWKFEDAEYFEFDENGVISRTYYEEILIPMEENLDRFLGTSMKTSHRSLWDLYERLLIEAQRGKGEYYNGLSTEFHSRLAFPLAAFLLGMLGYTFAVRSSIRSLVLEFGMALMSIVLYYALYSFWEKMGERGIAPPIVSAWATNILFTIALIWRFRRLEQVPG